MRPCTSPLEDFAAFAIAVCCGALLALALTRDVRKHPERVIHAER